VTLPPQRKSARLDNDSTPPQRKSARLDNDSTPNTKCLTDCAIGDYGQSPVAAAASTVLYSLQYGDGGVDGDDSDDSIASPSSGKADCSKEHDYNLDGLIFSDDEDFLIDVDSESEDERLRSSFPKDRKPKTIIPGGPQPPDLLNYLNLNVHPFGVNMSRRGRSMWIMNVTSD